MTFNRRPWQEVVSDPRYVPFLRKKILEDRNVEEEENEVDFIDRIRFMTYRLLFRKKPPQKLSKSPREDERRGRAPEREFPKGCATSETTMRMEGKQLDKRRRANRTTKIEK